MDPLLQLLVPMVIVFREEPVGVAELDIFQQHILVVMVVLVLELLDWDFLVVLGTIELLRLVEILVVVVVLVVLVEMRPSLMVALAQAEQEFLIRLVGVIFLMEQELLEDLILEVLVPVDHPVLLSFVIQYKKEKKYDYHRYNK